MERDIQNTRGSEVCSISMTSKYNLIRFIILCDEYRGNSKPKPRSTHEERYQNWVKRRDEGNQRAVQKAIKEDASSPPKEILSTFVMTDDEIKEKMPVWQEQFNTIMDKRQQEQDDVWRFVVK